MDAILEKELAATRLKAAVLNHRSQSFLVVAEMLSEYLQLVAIQQKQIDALAALLKNYGEKRLKPADPAVPETPEPPAG
jgi:hypothetical protein